MSWRGPRGDAVESDRRCRAIAQELATEIRARAQGRTCGGCLYHRGLACRLVISALGKPLMAEAWATACAEWRGKGRG